MYEDDQNSLSNTWLKSFVTRAQSMLKHAPIDQEALFLLLNYLILRQMESTIYLMIFNLLYIILKRN